MDTNTRQWKADYESLVKDLQCLSELMAEEAEELKHHHHEIFSRIRYWSQRVDRIANATKEVQS